MVRRIYLSNLISLQVVTGKDSKAHAVEELLLIVICHLEPRDAQLAELAWSSVQWRIVMLGMMLNSGHLNVVEGA